MSESDFTFKGQRPNEAVLNVVRRHPIVFFWPLLQSTLVLAVIVIVLVYFDFGVIFYIIAGIGLLYIFEIIFKIRFIYLDSFCLVTNQRVINVDQRGFFDRRITETELSKIQDVTNTTSGMWATALNFGEIIIQTAGTESRLIIKYIPDPYRLQQEITKNLVR